MANLIKLKRSAVPGKTPTVADLELGELAINTNDGKLFFEKDNGTASVVQVANAGINSDITELTGLTGGISSPHYIQFALDPSVAPAEGRLWYNPEDDTLNVGMSGGVVQQVGQEFFMPPCKNNSGVVINNGDFIMATGVSGDKVTIAKAITDGTIAPEYMIGVATQQITVDSEVGMVCTNGIVRDIDTSAWAVGTILYPNPAVAGGLTSTKPSAPNIKTPIAIVLRQHASTGRILVRMSTGSVLGGTDSNVEFTALSNADLVVYNSTNSRWENKSLVNVLGYTPANKAGDTFTGPVNFIDGNVGIGTSSPTTKLDIYGGAGNGRIQASVASVNPSLDLAADSTNGYFPAISFSGVGGGFGNFTGFAGTGMFYNFNSHVFRNASNVEYARINSSGNVGIGTSSPAEKLDVRGGTGNGSVSIHVASANAAINLKSDATNGYYPAINLYGANASGGLVGKLMGYDGVYLDAAGNRSVVLRTNGSEHLRLNGSVTVGIGTSSPSSKLPVAGALTLKTALTVPNGGTGAGTLTGLVVGNGTPAFTTVTAPSGAGVGTTDTQTLTSKRITPRVNAQTTTSSPWAWNSDSYDQQSFSALANALTINADAGTPTDGQKAMFRFKDNGTARALTWTTGTTNSFRAIGVTLPSTTVASKTTYVGCIYNAADSRWDVVAVTTE